METVEESANEPIEQILRHAKCCCGQFSLIIIGSPIRISMCHCFACQQRTGSAFGVQARFASNQILEINGNFSTYLRIGDSGNEITYKFCPVCASTICWNIQGMDDVTAVAIGALSDPHIGAPIFSVYTTRKHDWVHIPEDAEVWD